MNLPTAVAVFLLSASPALALDFTQPLTTLSGQPFTDPDSKVTITLATIAENALLQAYPDEQNLSGEEKLKRYTRARKIEDNKQKAELSAEEIALLKKLIAKLYNPLILGQSWKMLDPASVPK